MKSSKLVTLILVTILGISAIALFTYNYMYQSHRNVAEERAVAVVSATDLQGQFSKSQGGTESWTDQVVVVTGTATHVEQYAMPDAGQKITVVIDDLVQVDLDPKQLDQQPPMRDANLKVKGRCVGYDDLLEIVKIDQGILISQH